MIAQGNTVRELPDLTKVWKGDAEALGARLSKRTKAEIRFDPGGRALYATDASNYRQVPIGVVIPTCIQDVIDTVDIAREFGAPILSRGGGTSLAGQCCNVAVVIDYSKNLNKVIEINEGDRSVRTQPGVVLDDLRKAVRGHGLAWGPDPATHDHCTIGGMLGNNSCGIHSVMAQIYGPGPRTMDNVLEMEVLTYDGLRLRVGPTTDQELERIIVEGGAKGQIYAGLKRIRDRYSTLIRKRYPNIPRRVSGYNLEQLLSENGFNVARALVGTEATCVTILEAKLQLMVDLPCRTLVVLGYPDVYEAADDVMNVLSFKPVGLEGLDDRLIGFNVKRGMHRCSIHMMPPGRGWLLVEFGGQTQRDADERALDMMSAIKRESHRPPSMKLFDDPNEVKLIWEVRESGLGATAFVPGERDSWPGWEDSAVPPEVAGDYLRDLRSLFSHFGYNPSVYGHFGQGCIHCRIDFDLVTKQGLQKYRRFLDKAADLVLSYGGSLSGEHGDGQSRAELLPKMFGPELIQAFREFKSLWDPTNKMNPGKVVEAYPVLSNLRLGTDYNPKRVETHFKFPSDRHDFARAALRCVGVGKCRRKEGGTMCPSYMVTFDEEHTTRGRARMLWEMLNGDVIRHEWRNRFVHESLDLCLSCKGCKSDCPVNVDMATYKAEFLSHYYKGRLRPRAAYAMGLIYWWARIGSRMPRIVNYFSETSPFSTAMKWFGGISQERTIPKFATETFKHWFHHRAPRNLGSPRVILWADTFNNHFFPDVLKAAVEVIETAGFQVVVPEQSLCCGRPLYDFGMLNTAKRLLMKITEGLRDELRAGTPLVGLEPSCVAVFRDEAVNLFPNDLDIQRLNRQSFTLAEFIQRFAPDLRIPELPRKAVVHGHCHHKSIMGLDCEQELFERIGLQFEMLDSGCCGMAGSFGFETEKYDVSVKCGERVLLPAVRAASKETLIIADGFSCREQIAQLAQREALHTAQVLEMALRQPVAIAEALEEAEMETSSQYSPASRRSGLITGALALAGVAGFLSAVLWRRKHQG